MTHTECMCLNNDRLELNNSFKTNRNINKMNKRLPLLILMIATLLTHGQQITLQKNINYRANLLTQSLNADGDSLLLETKNKQINHVAIFNDNFTENIDIHSNKAKIDLKSLPVGNFIVQAELDKKLIIMYLKKNKDLKISSSEQIDRVINHKNLAPALSTSVVKEKEIPLYYWVVSEINSNFGSSKSMKLEHKEDIAKLITKNKLELKSDIGKDNKLHIYSVYNKSKFMSKQFRNPEYYKSTEKSKFFNTEPFYTSNNEKENDSNP